MPLALNLISASCGRIFFQLPGNGVFAHLPPGDFLPSANGGDDCLHILVSRDAVVVFGVCSDDLELAVCLTSGDGGRSAPGGASGLGSGGLVLLDATTAGAWPFKGTGRWTPGKTDSASETITPDTLENKSLYWNWLGEPDKTAVADMLGKASTYTDKTVSQTKYARQVTEYKKAIRAGGQAILILTRVIIMSVTDICLDNRPARAECQDRLAEKEIDETERKQRTEYPGKYRRQQKAAKLLNKRRSAD
ncbi:hypothetical protein QBC32DRAFT_314504 [Pseudoneurospora amorphoporcata]|uniref:Uncharacterized protein n=1 Tax=Pseudoneurospora amorphoporcata TaxID=241081 RepID=A0AAN6NTL0_9PEZI|nr:hypothetical protein QBC32DRAFT_314504 [Pseudoneurospora amorphoporcata]